MTDWVHELEQSIAKVEAERDDYLEALASIEKIQERFVVHQTPAVSALGQCAAIARTVLGKYASPTEGDPDSHEEIDRTGVVVEAEIRRLERLVERAQSDGYGFPLDNDSYQSLVAALYVLFRVQELAGKPTA